VCFKTCKGCSIEGASVWIEDDRIFLSSSGNGLAPFTAVDIEIIVKPKAL
jgi:hypothetical protein